MQLIARPYTVSDATALAANTAARHSQNTDEALDQGGTYEVTATECYNASQAMHTQGTDTTLGTMTAGIAMDGFNITGAGIICGGIDVIDVSEDTALTAEQCCGSFVLVSAACTVTLPAVSGVAEGGHTTIYSTGANLVKVDLNSVDRFVLDGAALSDDHMLDSESAAGNYITAVKDSAAGWTVVGRSGAFTDGGTS